MISKEKFVSKEELKRKLTRAIEICINKSTERDSGKYHDYKEPSVYKCVCCGNDLFNSDTNLILVQDGLVFGRQ